MTSIPRWDRTRLTPRGLPRPERMVVDGTEVKVCVTPGCGQVFPLERNSRGQTTSRARCSDCRALREDRRGGELPLPPGTPKCESCGAIVGLDLGSSVTHLDEAGLCSPCSSWQARRAEHERMVRAGYTRRGGLWFRDWSPSAWPRRRDE